MITKNLNIELSPKRLANIIKDDIFYQKKYKEGLTLCNFVSKEKKNYLVKIKPFFSEKMGHVYTAEISDGVLSRDYGLFYESKETLLECVASLKGKSIEEVETLFEDIAIKPALTV